MSFVSELDALPLDGLRETAIGATETEVRQSLARARLSLSDFARLLSPAAGALIEPMARQAQALTKRRFGNVIRLFAPLYLSNECVNACRYCGFARDNSIERVTLGFEEVEREARAVAEAGFRSILLVAGEHPRLVSNGYLVECVRRLRPLFSSISLEVGPMDVENYRACVEAGADGLVVYQETYDRTAYAALHPSGPKRDFARRLETPERGAQAGFRRIGIGALYGLADWRSEALCAAAHAEHLLKHCWKSALTLSFPRLRPCAGDFQPRVHLSDRELAQLFCAFRLFLPDAGLVLSTREAPRVRDGLIPLGVTMLSAGSHTEPGGYTGAGSERLAADATATGQFEIADNRSAPEVAGVIRRLGYEPVWKDWDAALSA